MYAPVAFRFRTYGVSVPDVVRDYMDTVFDDVEVRAWVDAALAETEIVEADEAGI